jgi:hypothetical protein
MKNIILLIANMIFNIIVAQSSNETTSTDLLIDINKTYVDARCCGEYKLYSIVRCQKGNGGDDDARGVKGTISLPPHITINKISIQQPQGAGFLDLGYSISEGTLEFISGKLTSDSLGYLRDSIKIEIEFTVDPITDDFYLSVSAFSLSPGDSYPSNNFWVSKKISTCKINLLESVITDNQRNIIYVKKLHELNYIKCKTKPDFLPNDFSLYKYSLQYKIKGKDVREIIALPVKDDIITLPEDFEKYVETNLLIYKSY